MVAVIHTPEFIDAQEMAKKHPDTFWAPEQKQLDAIEPEDIVKVCDGEERFWVEVQAVCGDKLTARVDNNLVGEQEYNYGSLVKFEKRHVYDIYERETSDES